MTSIYDKPAAVRDLPKPAPRPVPSDAWFLVTHPLHPGIRTYFRDRDDADARSMALTARYGQRNVNGRLTPRVEVVDGLPGYP